MQTTSATMLTALSQHEASVFDTTSPSFGLIEVIEVYSSSYSPHVTNGFEPSAAEKRWGSIQGLTFLTLAYERYYFDRGEIHRFQDKRENNVSITFSNVPPDETPGNRPIANWIHSTAIEGKQLVIRVLSITSTVIADSLVIFTGRLDKPGDFDDTSGSLTATQRFGQINQQFPPRTFSPNDPKGRASNDPLFEGFRFTSSQATVQWTTRERRQGFGGLVGLTKKIYHSFQASSHTDVSSEVAVPDGFGRIQLYGRYLGTLDIGGAINFSVAVCEGGDEGIDSYIFIKQINPKFTQISANPAMFYGYPGNTGPSGREQKPIRILNPSVPNHPGDGYHSLTAWFAGFVSGSSVDIDEAEAPDWMILIKAKRIKVPDGSGVFTNREWTDVPAYVARHLLSHERYFNEGEAAIEDPVCWETGKYNSTYVLDSTKGEWTYVPEADAALLGTEFTLLRSTSLVDARRVRMTEIAADGLFGDDPHSLLAEIEPFDPGDPPEPGDVPTNTNLRNTVLRVRHTCNVVLLERMSGLDFLYNVVAPTGRLFFRRNGKGKIEIHTEKPADNTRLRTATSIGATSVPVTDVDPWKIGSLLLTQKLLIGNTLTTSEVRTVSAANYTTDANSITLTSSGSGLTATASGATLSGGSSSVAASGTVTLSGTPNAGDSVTITINGLAYTYVLDGFDTLESAANLCAKTINATPKLNAFLKATSSGAVITITAKWGVLTVGALANAHTAQVASPTSAPGGSVGNGGTLVAGTYQIGYAWRTANGMTALSPISTHVVGTNQLVTIPAVTPLPGTVLDVVWFASKYPDSTELVFVNQNDGSGFNFGQTVMPTQSNSLAPDVNESGEEILRVAMSFSSNDQGSTVLAQTGLLRGNIHAGTFKWPLPGKQSSTNLVTGTFFDSTEDYAPTPLEVHDYAHQTQIRKVNKKEVDLSGFDNYKQASCQLNFILSKHREGDWFNSLSAGPYAMLLEEGDIICGSSDNGGLINVVTRAEEISIGPPKSGWTTKIVGRKYSTRMFSDNVRQHTIQLPTTLRTVTPLPTLFELVDSQAIRDVDSIRDGFYWIPSFDDLAVGSWRGSALKAELGGEYVEIVRSEVVGQTGTSTGTALPAVTTTYVDNTNTFTVRIKNGTLPSWTLDELNANQTRGLIRLGDEFLQYTTATLTDAANREYTIGPGLLRGRFGTATSHTTSERFAVMAQAVFVPFDLAYVNQAINFKAVTYGENDATAIARSFTWSGGTHREPAPTNIVRHDDSAGNQLWEWDDVQRGGLGIHAGRAGLGEVVTSQFEVDVFTTSGYTTKIARSPILVTTGKQMAAVLISDSDPANKFDGVNGNDVASRGSGFNVIALQRITRTDNVLEATLNLGTLSSAGSYVLLGVFPSTAAWYGITGLVPQYAIRSTRVGGSDMDVTVEVNGTVVLTSTIPAAAIKSRIVFSGTEVRFYLNSASNKNADFISKVVPIFPLRPLIRAVHTGTAVGVQDVMLTTDPDPKTIYALIQQTEDFGGAQTTVYADFYKINRKSGLRGWPARVALINTP